MNVYIKYFCDELVRIEKISKGDWIDLRAAGIMQDIIVMGYYVPGQERAAKTAPASTSEAVVHFSFSILMPSI